MNMHEVETPDLGPEEEFERPLDTRSLDALMREKTPFDPPLADGQADIINAILPDVTAGELGWLTNELRRAKARHISVEQATAEKAQAVLDEVDRIFTALMILRDDYAPGSPAYRALTLAGYEVTGKRPS